jgi:outer membrane protein OmpA-like peptidoglycan-associated protein
VLAPSTATAGDFEFGVYGGWTTMDDLEVLGSTWNLTPRVGYMFDETIGIELDFAYSAGQTTVGIPDTYSYSSMTPRIGLLGILLHEEAIRPTLNLGVGVMTKSINDNGDLGLPTGANMDVDFVANAGPGFIIPIAGPVAFRSDLRWIMNFGSESYQNRGDTFVNWEFTSGVMVNFGGPKDADKDGIVDEDDQCPENAEDVDQFEDEDGCPDEDNDQDGIADASDECPIEAEDMDEFEDEDGCPEADNDEDGVLDGDDKCPLKAGTEATEGCPDADGDGLADAVDECENEAGDAKSFGCPDSDGDRVPDWRDDCPEDAAPPAVDARRSDGCSSRAYVAENKIVITETIEFNSGKATLKKESHGLLDDIVALLDKYKGIKKLQIQGHTDSQGDDESNLTLSQDRVRSVGEYLIENGVDKKRLKPEGFGETKPIADNETAEGRAENRRVEFVILEQDVSKATKRKVKAAQTENPDAPKKPEEEKKEE